MQVSVVKAKSPMLESASVNWEIRLDFPTLGKPTSATEASPDFLTSKPGPPPLALACACAFSFRALSAAILALSLPMWP